MSHAPSNTGDVESEVGTPRVVDDASLSNQLTGENGHAFSSMNEEFDLSVSNSSFGDFVRHNAAVFVSKFYGKPSLPRNVVQEIIDETQNLIIQGSVVMDMLKTKVMRTLTSVEAPTSDIEEITAMFSALETPFDHLKTEYLRLKYFEASGYYVPPKTIMIGKQLENVKTKEGTIKATWVDVTAEHIPVSPILKQFLELPDALSSILKFMDLFSNDPDSISNVIQGELWQRKRAKYPANAVVLPLFGYYDSFQADNVIGPHCRPIGGIYISIGCLPPKIASKLENIFVSTLFHAADMKEFPIERFIQPLLDELESLKEEGIEVLPFL